jgi:hypothetical protein
MNFAAAVPSCVCGVIAANTQGKHTQLLIPLLQQRLRARAVMTDVTLLLAVHAACAARTWRMRHAHD